MKSITVLVPGKLMLFGEYGVLYGTPCIATALNQRLTVQITECQDSRVILNTPESTDQRFIHAVLTAFPQVNGVVITVKSPFSGKYGFGSSAAVTIGALLAVDTYIRHSGKSEGRIQNRFWASQNDKRRLLQKAYEIVQTVQGQASGFDLATVLYGGTIYFEKENLRVTSVSIDFSEIACVVGYSGTKAETRTMIARVEQFKKTHPVRFKKTVTAIGNLVKEVKIALEEKRWIDVGKLMDINQVYVRDLGVSTEKLEQMIGAVKEAGAFGAKISGAGGGDSIIVFAPLEKKAAVEKAILKVGGEVVEVSLNATGVKLV